MSRDYIRLLVEQVDRRKEKSAVGGGLAFEDRRVRDQALISFLYLSARRISELVGRKYRGDVYGGIQTSDFTFSTLEKHDVVLVRCRILKKWKRKVDLPDIRFVEVVLDAGDEPFISYITDWLHLQEKRGVEKYMPISRVRAYQILTDLDPRIVGPHWFRHQRLSHLAESLSPYELNERIGFWESIEPSIAYVHGRVSKYLTACENARGEEEEKLEQL